MWGPISGLMEELEYVAKKEYEGKIARINPIVDIEGGQLICVSGDPNNKMKAPVIHIDSGMSAINGQPFYSMWTAFPIYTSEIQHWAPGKKVKITVEVVD